MCEYKEGTFSIEAPIEMKELVEKLGYKPCFITEPFPYKVVPLQPMPAEVRERYEALIKRCQESHK